MSDILIKGMKMPEGCFRCPLSVKHSRFDGNEWHRGGFVLCKEVSDDGEKDEDCSLIPVPAHGRLIEAHFDYVEFKKRYEEAFGDNFDLYNAFSIFNDMIVNAPTIIEANNGHTD